MVYQVGRPAMFDGNMFLPETGTPIWKMARSRTVLALCDPEPFTVATWILKSLTTGLRTAPGSAPCTANSVVAINTPYQRMDVAVGKHFIIRQRASGAKWESVVILAGIGVLRLAPRGGLAPA